ncbi:MAG TPA: hypothetical protein VLB76_21355 [Thermoanaerobaculia bacterium]|jgi:dipeptidyl aminopeptidase/acylaminoacyl peptidase|nr:hypothetical protein [Thermoanaerobaculia bacterium]
MRASWLLVLLLAAAAPGGPGRLAVLGSDGRVTVLSGDHARTLLPPHPKAVFVSWAPAGDRLAAVEEVKPGTVTPFRLIVRGVEKGNGKPRQIQPSSQDFLLWREIVGLAWPRTDLITDEGRIDPDTVVMAQIDPRSGALLSSQPGKWFFWSPAGSRLAAIGWIPHFGPEPKEGDCVEIDGRIVYQGAKGNVIHPPLLWSPDGGQLAFVEQHGDSRDLLIAPTTPGAALRRFAVAARSALLAWSDDGREAVAGFDSAAAVPCMQEALARKSSFSISIIDGLARIQSPAAINILLKQFEIGNAFDRLGVWQALGRIDTTTLSDELRAKVDKVLKEKPISFVN